jgi:hypothetical protein
LAHGALGSLQLSGDLRNLFSALQDGSLPMLDA